MANNPSARKRIRQNEKRNERNTARRSRVRSFIRKLEDAISGGDKAAAQAAFQAAQPEMMRAADKGVLHDNTVARKLSRLSARVKALGAPAQG
ncbi:30S ribosomal protein S20 [Roseomonas sp. BN140053]|uniref:30S ribosomal protein S20 n=1 Tax=Roseomonas sp. BN140053 TaxID=3391898 RepID=UPI0039EAB5E2